MKGKKSMPQINIVLYEPEIPQNTGNIARTCAATGARLHLIHPLGFVIDDKKLKRAGLDYWDKLDITHYENADAFFAAHADKAIYPFSTKAPRAHVSVSYPEEVYLLFGPESRGLPEDVIARFGARAVRIPMRATLRSLNLSNSVAIAVYEVLRQYDFDGLTDVGAPTTFSW